MKVLRDVKMLLASLRDVLEPKDDFVKFEKSCIVPDDFSEVVTHAHPTTERDRAQIREQKIEKMRYDEVAVSARERQIAISRGRALRFIRKNKQNSYGSL